MDDHQEDPPPAATVAPTPLATKAKRERSVEVEVENEGESKSKRSKKDPQNEVKKDVENEVEKHSQIGRKGEVTIVNADDLFPVEKNTFLGNFVYSPPTTDSDLFLLPELNSNHLFATLQVRVPREHLSFKSNKGVTSRALWGTDIYTDDSDIVAVVIHSGHYRPVDCPAFKHHVSTKQSTVDQHKANPPQPLKSEDSTSSSPITVEAESAPTLIATPHPLYPDQPLNDLLVTIRVLPRLTKYTGTTCSSIDKESPEKLFSDVAPSNEPSTTTSGRAPSTSAAAAEDDSNSFSLSTSTVFASRGWGGSHQGESIRIERVMEVPSKQSFPGVLRTANHCFSKTATSPISMENIIQRGASKASARKLGSGRKSGAIEWCAIGIQERMLGVVGASAVAGGGVSTGVAGGAGTAAAIGGRRRSVVGPGILVSSFSSALLSSASAPAAAAVSATTINKKKGMYEAVRVLFSSKDGRACFKYSPQILLEWPKFLQDSLVDLNTKLHTDTPPSSTLTFGLTGPELKRMEGWAYWRVRLSVPGTILELEDETGTRFEVSRNNPTSTVSDSYKISGVSSLIESSPSSPCSPVVVGLSDLEWRNGGMYIKGLQQLFEADRFSFSLK
ncbi:UNVERIFIED_CONTAM: hypothetical protein HDU68_006754 [Siphonaria sp. JEL0065]|nr:hypothetical protein HDU68_006754 [Siphonaria sp. JEL0065]